MTQAVAYPQHVRFHCNGRHAKGAAQHQFGGLAPHPGQCREYLQGVGKLDPTSVGINYMYII